MLISQSPIEPRCDRRTASKSRSVSPGMLVVETCASHCVWPEAFITFFDSLLPETTAKNVFGKAEWSVTLGSND